MEKTITISWRELTGNKFMKAIDPAMASQAGCIKSQRIRRIGDSEKTIFNVRYDREYLVQVLLRKVCRRLSVLGKEEVLFLVSEAWDLYDKECLHPTENFSADN